MQRYDIEGNSAEYIAEVLKGVFDDACSNMGPSISKEDFDKVLYAKQCGSKIPLFKV
jgi:hypothetical protein